MWHPDQDPNSNLALIFAITLFQLQLSLMMIGLDVSLESHSLRHMSLIGCSCFELDLSLVTSDTTLLLH